MGLTFYVCLNFVMVLPLALSFLNKIIQPNFYITMIHLLLSYSCDDGAYVPHRFFCRYGH